MLRKTVIVAAMMLPAVAFAQTTTNPAGGTTGPSANPPAMKGNTMPAQPEGVKPNPAGGAATGTNANTPAKPNSTMMPTGTDPAKKDPAGGGTTGKP